MVWKIEYVRSAEKQLGRLDRTWQRRILDFMDNDIGLLDDPRQRGKVLVGNRGGFWRYRVGDYRVICSIDGSIRIILVLKVSHRRDVYD